MYGDDYYSTLPFRVVPCEGRSDRKQHLVVDLDYVGKPIPKPSYGWGDLDPASRAVAAPFPVGETWDSAGMSGKKIRGKDKLQAVVED